MVKTIQTEESVTHVVQYYVEQHVLCLFTECFLNPVNICVSCS